MDKFATLEPTRLYQSTARAFRSGPSQPSKPTAPAHIGLLPPDLHLLILSHLPVPDFPSYARASRATSKLSTDDKLWESRWKVLDQPELGSVLDELEERTKQGLGKTRASGPTIVQVIDDDFGEFADVDVGMGGRMPIEEELGDFEGTSSTFHDIAAVVHPTPTTARGKYMRAHRLLKPLTTALALSPPHLILNALDLDSSSLLLQARSLHLLALFLSARVQPIRQWFNVGALLRGAMDRFDATLLAAFDLADGQGDERGMREAAVASWEVYDTSSTNGWEMGKVWAEKRELFWEYEAGRWDPLANLVAANTLSFDAMDEFMTYIMNEIIEHGSRAARVFPPQSDVLLMFAARVGNDVVEEYISSLLTRAREISAEMYLVAAAATFKESLRIVDAVLTAAGKESASTVDRTRAEDVVYQMFEANMDEYLDEEVESVKQTFEVICRAWDHEIQTTASTNLPTLTNSSTTAHFLGSHNPAQMKRNVLASFTNVLMLPVTIVPRMGAAGMDMVGNGMNAAVAGMGMLNPARWGGSTGNNNAKSGYSSKIAAEETVEKFQVGSDDEEEEEVDEELNEKDDNRVGREEEKSVWDDVPSWTEKRNNDRSSSLSLSSPSRPSSTAPTSIMSAPGTGVGISTPITASTSNKLELHLSLDVALELIHADREALKRVETFAGYPGHYGHRVRDTIEEIFMLMLSILGDRHVGPGFHRATEQMLAYKPADHQDVTSVAPILQFFELVHIGDTIQSMVQVYFDKELAAHIDRSDFINPVVREKKRFENILDDAVAKGLNAGTEVLMNQVEHIIQSLTKPRAYYPPEDEVMDLGPTEGCTAAIKCLDTHCKLLKGSTNKEVLEVFYQEVGIRLLAIIQKHIKRQIISLAGGFQVIADLNTYNTFISSLKVQSITSDFAHLKMLGHVYVVEDAKDLAQIVRDVSRYGGSYRPEDIYEFIQRRSDWKKIEKTVDKTMYNLSFKEDCVIA